jgi:hypothetical protein
MNHDWHFNCQRAEQRHEQRYCCLFCCAICLSASSRVNLRRSFLASRSISTIIISMIASAQWNAVVFTIV